MAVYFVFPNVKTTQKRLEALKTAGGISTSGHTSKLLFLLSVSQTQIQRQIQRQIQMQSQR